MKADPLTLGQRLVAVLEDGKRTETYKFAVMVALLDLAVESVPEDPADEVAINLDSLTERVMELYWHQLRPLEGQVLKHTTTARGQRGGAILGPISELRELATPASGAEVPFATVRDKYATEFAAAVLEVKKNLVRYPLKLLQELGPNSERFLYEDGWMKRYSESSIQANGNQIVLKSGVCFDLARLAPLVKPAFQLSWLDKIRDINPKRFEDYPDLSAHLFGSERVSLERPGGILAEVFGSECFYCAAHLRKPEVDHVLPWSRVSLDGLANLVLSCGSCNGDKSSVLPQPGHVARALDRGVDLLGDLAKAINWPSQYDRVSAAAHGIYATQPTSTPVWFARQDVRPMGRVDFSWPPPK